MISPLRLSRFRLHRTLPVAVVPGVLALSLLLDWQIGWQPNQLVADAQIAANRALTLRSDVQEANAKTGVVTARGNVQINYPARQIQATAAQAQYFSRERRIVLSGNVYVLQQGNSMRGETITYLIDEGRFVALPEAPKQVESIYLVPESSPLTPTPAQTPSPFGAQPEFTPPTTGPATNSIPSGNRQFTTPLPPSER